MFFLHQLHFGSFLCILIEADQTWSITAVRMQVHLYVTTHLFDVLLGPKSKQLTLLDALEAVHVTSTCQVQSKFDEEFKSSDLMTEIIGVGILLDGWAYINCFSADPAITLIRSGSYRRIYHLVLPVVLDWLFILQYGCTLRWILRQNGIRPKWFGQNCTDHMVYGQNGIDLILFK